MKKVIYILFMVVTCCLLSHTSANAQQALWGAYPDAFYNTTTASVYNTYQEVLKDVNLGSRATNIEIASDNTIYGVTTEGVIFKYVPGNAKPSELFRSATVSSIGITTIDSDAGYMYGNCIASGISSLFSMRVDGTEFTILRGDDGSGHGAYSMQLQLGDKLYGLRQPSASGYQIYFTMNTDGTNYTEIRNFTDPTQRPTSLFHKPGSNEFVVLSSTGGSCGRGAVFALSIDGATYYKSLDFRGTDFNCGGAGGPEEDLPISDGENPINVAFDEGYQFTYILTDAGGPGEHGKLVALAPDGFWDILSFSYGTRPDGGLVVTPDGKVIGFCGAQDDASGKVFSHDPATQSNEFDIILDFDYPPYLVSLPGDIEFGTDGRIYGTSFWAAFQNLEKGTLFSFESDGTDLQRHYYFENNFGPNGIVFQDNAIFGMFRNSVAIPVPGETGYTTGSIFRYDEDGLENIYIFPRFEADSTRLTSGNDGYIYGVNASSQFMLKVKSDGTTSQRTALPAFKSNAALSVTASGIYGTSYGSDANPDGFIYKVKADFSGIDIIYTFSSATGSKPRGKVVEYDGYLFGATSSGGTSANGVVFKVQTNGSGYTVLHNFDGANGAKPYGGVTLTSGASGIFHGMTSAGGTNNTGVIFRINADGSGFQKEYDFGTFSGGTPKGEFVFSIGSPLYGMTTTGGAFGHGALFAFSGAPSPHLTKLKDFDRAPLPDLVRIPGQVGPLSYVVTPADGAHSVSSNPEIELQAVPDATQYIVELSTAEDFSCCVLTKTFTTNKGTFEGLEYNTTYFALVKTNISPSYGPLTSFTTGNSVGDTYVIAPADSAEFVAINDLAVTANLVSGAALYTIELNTSPDFTGTSFVQTSIEPGERTLIFNGLSYVTRYYARAKTDLSPAWGSTTTFKTIGTESYVIDPADNETGVTYSTTFQMQPVAGASRYYLVLDFVRTNGDAGTQTVDNETPTINLMGLAYSATYTTRVKTDVNPNYGPSTTFYTLPATVDSYVISPANGATNVPTTVDVQANNVGDAYYYTIELNTSSDFTGTSFVQTSDEMYKRTFTFTGLAPSTTYYNRVKTELDPGWGATRSFTTTTVSTVLILDPSDLEEDVSVKPVVKVSTIPGANQYTVQLSETANFSGTLITVNSANPNIQVPGPLKYSKLYYARAKTNLNTSYGVVSRFKTHAPNKYAFVSNPVDGAGNVATSVQVTANIVYGATQYVIELNPNQNFSGTSIVRTSATSGQRTLMFTGLASGTKYYSRVKTNLTAAYGPVRSFTTVAQPTYVTSPANNATEVLVTSAIQAVPVPAATQYTLEVSNSSDFTGPVSTFTSPSPGMTAGLLSYSTRYYMRVKTNLTGFGQVTTFITHAAEKFSFVSHPVNGATNVGTVNVPITANIVYGASIYTIELNTSPDFTGTSIVRSSAVPNQRGIIFDALQPGTKYYNRTRTNLPSNWGPVRSFTTAGSPPPPPVVALETSGVKVYPNPFNANFTAEILEGTNVNLAIFDVTGKQVMSTPGSKGQSLQLGTELSQGVYILKIQEGTKLTIHRMVKQ